MERDRLFPVDGEFGFDVSVEDLALNSTGERRPAGFEMPAPTEMILDQLRVTIGVGTVVGFGAVLIMQAHPITDRPLEPDIAYFPARRRNQSCCSKTRRGPARSRTPALTGGPVRPPARPPATPHRRCPRPRSCDGPDPAPSPTHPTVEQHGPSSPSPTHAHARQTSPTDQPRPTHRHTPPRQADVAVPLPRIRRPLPKACRPHPVRQNQHRHRRHHHPAARHTPIRPTRRNHFHSR